MGDDHAELGRVEQQAETGEPAVALLAGDDEPSATLELDHECGSTGPAAIEGVGPPGSGRIPPTRRSPAGPRLTARRTRRPTFHVEPPPRPPQARNALPRRPAPRRRTRRPRAPPRSSSTIRRQHPARCDTRAVWVAATGTMSSTWAIHAATRRTGTVKSRLSRSRWENGDVPPEQEPMGDTMNQCCGRF